MFITSLINNFLVMKIRVFPNRLNRYDYVEYEVDSLALVSSHASNDYLPSLFLDDVIQDLISKN